MGHPQILQKVLLEGEEDTIKIKAGTILKPDAGWAFLLLSGRAYHVTGTATVFVCYTRRDISSTDTFHHTLVAAAASATNTYPLYNTAAGEAYAQAPNFVLISDQDEITVTGDAGAYVIVRILKAKVA